jgi:hypothetical protein
VRKNGRTDGRKEGKKEGGGMVDTWMDERMKGRGTQLQGAPHLPWFRSLRVPSSAPVPEQATGEAVDIMHNTPHIHIDILCMHRQVDRSTFGTRRCIHMCVEETVRGRKEQLEKEGTVER